MVKVAGRRSEGNELWRSLRERFGVPTNRIQIWKNRLQSETGHLFESDSMTTKNPRLGINELYAKVR